MRYPARMLFTSVLGLALLLVAAWSVQAQSPTPQPTLAQSVADLQKTPADSSLREKIIKLALGMKPAPPVPEEVDKHEGAAEYAFKHAKTESDYADSAREYEQALLIAPWLAADYFNCGVAYEKAGDPKSAARFFSFYLMAAPEAQDAREVRKRIGGLEYASEQAAKEKLASDRTERQRQEEALAEAKKGGPEGKWRLHLRNGHNADLPARFLVLEKDSSGSITVKEADVSLDRAQTIGVQVDGRNIKFTVVDWFFSHCWDLTLSEDRKWLSGTQTLLHQDVQQIARTRKEGAIFDHLTEEDFRPETVQYERQEELSREAIAARSQQAQKDEWLRKLDGARYAYHERDQYGNVYYITLDIHGDEIAVGRFESGVWQKSNILGSESFVIQGRHFVIKDLTFGRDEQGTISDDGQTITFSLGSKGFVYRREH